MEFYFFLSLEKITSLLIQSGWVEATSCTGERNKTCCFDLVRNFNINHLLYVFKMETKGRLKPKLARACLFFRLSNKVLLVWSGFLFFGGFFCHFMMVPN